MQQQRISSAMRNNAKNNISSRESVEAGGGQRDTNSLRSSGSIVVGKKMTIQSKNSGNVAASDYQSSTLNAQSNPVMKVQAKTQTNPNSDINRQLTEPDVTGY